MGVGNAVHGRLSASCELIAVVGLADCAPIAVVGLAGESTAAAGEGGIGDVGGEGVENIEDGPVAIGAEGGDGGDGDDSVEGCTCVLWIAAAVPSSSACACAIIASACSSSMSSSSLCTWSIVSTISTVSLDDAHEPPLPGGSGICISGTAAAPCTPKPPIVKNVVLSACTGSAAAACTIAAAAAFLSLLPVGARSGTKSMPSFAACFRRASSIFLEQRLVLPDAPRDGALEQGGRPAVTCVVE